MDDRLKQLLKELGDAINNSISSSEAVNQHIQKIRDEGYDIYVVLDATIGIGRNDEDADESPSPSEDPAEVMQQRLAIPGAEVQFRINVNDLAFLRSVGIDPTRKVKHRK